MKTFVETHKKKGGYHKSKHKWFASFSCIKIKKTENRNKICQVVGEKFYIKKKT